MKLYVGNLTTDVTEEDLRQEFQPFGQIDTVTIIKDRFRDVSRGFAFVEMPVEAEAKAAIAGLQGKQLKGKTMDVNEARPKEQRRGGGGFGGGGRRGGGGGYGGGKSGGGGYGGGGGRGGGRRSW